MSSPYIFHKYNKGLIYRFINPPSAKCGYPKILLRTSLLLYPSTLRRTSKGGQN